MTRRRASANPWRRTSQLVFLVVFFVLLTLTVWPLGNVYLGAFLVSDPLIAANSLANGVWKPPMIAAVFLVLAPLLVGRAFCGYVCPMGTIIELTAGRPRPSRITGRTRELLRALPSFILLACAGLLLFASSTFLLFDPLSTLTRTSTVLAYPALDRLLRLIGDVVYLMPGARGGVDTIWTLLAGRLVFSQPLVFGLTLAVFGMFALILGASYLEPRLWCRHLCPLGALFGLVGRRAILGRIVDTEKCISCGACSEACPLGAVSDDFHATDTSRCQLGLECSLVCPTDAIGLGVRPAKADYSPGRRALVLAGVLSFGAGYFAFTGLRRRTVDPRLIRPPGARPETDLLALCSRCGQCMKTCPTNVIQPSLSKTGPLGIFTPEMDYRIGSCEWSCAECGRVCPTGAIDPLELAEKRTTVIGRAYIDTTRCIPWVDAKSCLVCQELCPLPEKAIVFTEDAVTTALGDEVTVRRPHVIAERCIGCGVCEFNCPVPHESAIVVRGVGPERTT